MAFVDMVTELTGVIPKMPYDYAATLVNRSYRDIRRKNLWSFQLFEASWVSPATLNAGTVSCNLGSTIVTFDATASAAILAATSLGPFPTPWIQRQFRVGISTIYNIWAVNFNTPTAIQFTLDRPYTDSSGAGQGYIIFQCYYPVPMKDFLTWITVRDIVNFNDLVLTKTRSEINFMDPQRTIFYLPTHCVGYQNDLNPASPTYGWFMYELWGQPQYELVYQLYGIRKGTDLVNDTDTLPGAIGEDCVMELAKYYAYQWAEGTKGDMPRNQGSDFKFLMGASLAEYKRLYREYRQQDREAVDNWYDIRRHHTWLSNVDGYYSSIGNVANPGSPWLVFILILASLIYNISRAVEPSLFNTALS